MAIIASSPLIDLTVDIPFSISLGDGAGGYTWYVPPGSLLPPGIHLKSNTGVLYGVPTLPGSYAFYVKEVDVNGNLTQREFSLNVKNQSGTQETTIVTLIENAFQLGKTYPGQVVWFDEELDIQGRKVFSLKVNDAGQERTISSITIA